MSLLDDLQETEERQEPIFIPRNIYEPNPAEVRSSDVTESASGGLLDDLKALSPGPQTTGQMPPLRERTITVPEWERPETINIDNEHLRRAYHNYNMFLRGLGTGPVIGFADFAGVMDQWLNGAQPEDERWGYGLSQALREIEKDYLPVDDRHKKEFFSYMWNGLGSGASMMIGAGGLGAGAASVAGRLGTLGRGIAKVENMRKLSGVVATGATAAGGAMQNSAQFYREAELLYPDASHEELMTMAGWGAFSGLTEVAGVGKLAGKMLTAKQIKGITRALAEASFEGGEEMLQEAGQRVMQVLGTQQSGLEEFDLGELGEAANLFTKESGAAGASGFILGMLGAVGGNRNSRRYQEFMNAAMEQYVEETPDGFMIREGENVTEESLAALQARAGMSPKQIAATQAMLEEFVGRLNELTGERKTVDDYLQETYTGGFNLSRDEQAYKEKVSEILRPMFQVAVQDQINPIQGAQIWHGLTSGNQAEFNRALTEVRTILGEEAAEALVSAAPPQTVKIVRTGEELDLTAITVAELAELTDGTAVRLTEQADFATVTSVLGRTFVANAPREIQEQVAEFYVRQLSGVVDEEYGGLIAKQDQPGIDIGEIRVAPHPWDVEDPANDSSTYYRTTTTLTGRPLEGIFEVEIEQYVSDPSIIELNFAIDDSQTVETGAGQFDSKMNLLFNAILQYVAQDPTVKEATFVGARTNKERASDTGGGPGQRTSARNRAYMIALLRKGVPIGYDTPDGERTITSVAQARRLIERGENFLNLRFKIDDLVAQAKVHEAGLRKRGAVVKPLGDVERANLKRGYVENAMLKRGSPRLRNAILDNLTMEFMRYLYTGKAPTEGARDTFNSLGRLVKSAYRAARENPREKTEFPFDAPQGAQEMINRILLREREMEGGQVRLGGKSYQVEKYEYFDHNGERRAIPVVWMSAQELQDLAVAVTEELNAREPEYFSGPEYRERSQQLADFTDRISDLNPGVDRTLDDQGRRGYAETKYAVDVSHAVTGKTQGTVEDVLVSSAELSVLQPRAKHRNPVRRPKFMRRYRWSREELEAATHVELNELRRKYGIKHSRVTADTKPETREALVRLIEYKQWIEEQQKLAIKLSEDSTRLIDFLAGLQEQGLSGPETAADAWAFMMRDMTQLVRKAGSGTTKEQLEVYQRLENTVTLGKLLMGEVTPIVDKIQRRMEKDYKGLSVGERRRYAEATKWLSTRVRTGKHSETTRFAILAESGKSGKGEWPIDEAWPEPKHMEEVLEILELWEELIRVTGQQAVRHGLMTFERDASGKVTGMRPFVPQKDARVFPRQFTAEGMAILLAQDSVGRKLLAEALVELNPELSYDYVMTKLDEVKRRKDSRHIGLELIRQFDRFPTHLKIPRRLKGLEHVVGRQTVEILESRPFYAAEKMAYSTAQRIAFVSKEGGKFPQERELMEAFIEEYSQHEPDHERDHAVAIERAVRSANGVPLEDEFWLMPGSPGYNASQWGLIALAWHRVKVLGQAAFVNVPETLNNTRVFGGTTRYTQALVQMAAEVVKSTGKKLWPLNWRRPMSVTEQEYLLGQITDYAVRTGALTHINSARLLGRHNILATMNALTESGTRTLLNITGLTPTIRMNEMISMQTARLIVQDIRRRGLNVYDEHLMRDMGLTEQELEQLRAKQVTPFLEARIVNKFPVFTQGTGQHPLESSTGQRTSWVKNSFYFWSYARVMGNRTLDVYGRLGREVALALDSGKKGNWKDLWGATTRALDFTLGAAVAGAAGNMVKLSFVYGLAPWAIMEFFDWDEDEDGEIDAESVVKFFMESMSYSLMSGPAVAIERGLDEGETNVLLMAARMLSYYGAIEDFTNAVLVPRGDWRTMTPPERVLNWMAYRSTMLGVVEVGAQRANEVLTQWFGIQALDAVYEDRQWKLAKRVWYNTLRDQLDKRVNVRVIKRDDEQFQRGLSLLMKGIENIDMPGAQKHMAEGFALITGEIASGRISEQDFKQALAGKQMILKVPVDERVKVMNALSPKVRQMVLDHDLMIRRLAGIEE